MKTKHINIPIFIPHMGCPHECIFCNQRTISGKNDFNIENVENEIQTALSTIDFAATEVEIAFFGGSFTGIDRGLMINLLEIANKYVQVIRLSTRPDYIDAEILSILKRYNVKTIELGIQCLNDDVLNVCKRGHTAEQAIDACNQIKNAQFDLIGQMMVGLPSSTLADEVYTAETLCEFVDGTRIYPTTVLENTELAATNYVPPDTDEMIKRACDVFAVFVKNNIPVIRIGLATNGIPAFGELVENEYYYRLLKKYHSVENLIIECPKGHTSKVIGQNKRNKYRLNVKNIKIVEKNEILGYNININIMEGEEFICV
ncbi:MAG: radical SAM protein [Oscillospiraceae bacterium]|nr:radical SAM protein [Oscillospiraceae bacterium]